MGAKLQSHIPAPGGGGGHSNVKGGYQARPKIHVIRVVFQDQAMYECSWFRGEKTCKIGKKGVFLVMLTNFGKDMIGKLRKNACKNVYLGSIFPGLFSYLKNM